MAIIILIIFLNLKASHRELISSRIEIKEKLLNHKVTTLWEVITRKRLNLISLDEETRFLMIFIFSLKNVYFVWIIKFNEAITCF